MLEPRACSEQAVQQREWEGDQGSGFADVCGQHPPSTLEGCLRDREGTCWKIKDVEFKLALFTKWEQMALGTQQEMKSSIEVGLEEPS